MKRFQIQRGGIRLPHTPLVLVAAAVMVMAASMAFAATQEFTNFTLDIPDGWTAKEDSPSVVVTKNDDPTVALNVTLDALQGGDTYVDFANKLAEYLKGTKPEVDADGDCIFKAPDGNGGEAICLVRGNDSVYLYFLAAGMDKEGETLAAIMDSISLKQ